jgi:hypothetical protein
VVVERWPRISASPTWRSLPTLEAERTTVVTASRTLGEAGARASSCRRFNTRRSRGGQGTGPSHPKTLTGRV